MLLPAQLSCITSCVPTHYCIYSNIARFCEVMSQGSRKLLIGHTIAGVLPVFAVEACKGDSVFQTLEEWPTVATTSRHLWKNIHQYKY